MKNNHINGETIVLYRKGLPPWTFICKDGEYICKQRKHVYRIFICDVGVWIGRKVNQFNYWNDTARIRASHIQIDNTVIIFSGYLKHPERPFMQI